MENWAAFSFETYLLLSDLQLKSDVNPFQRNFVNEVRQAEEMERKLRFLEAEIQRELRTRLNPLPAIDLDNPSMTDTINMGELENRLDQLEADIRQYNTNQVSCPFTL